MSNLWAAIKTLGLVSILAFCWHLSGSISEVQTDIRWIKMELKK